MLAALSTLEDVIAARVSRKVQREELEAAADRLLCALESSPRRSFTAQKGLYLSRSRSPGIQRVRVSQQTFSVLDAFQECGVPLATFPSIPLISRRVRLRWQLLADCVEKLPGAA